MLEKIGDDGLENGVGKSQSFWQKKLDVLILDLQKEKSDLVGRRSKEFYSKIDWQETIAHLSVWLVLLEKMKKENCIEEIKSTM